MNRSHSCLLLRASLSAIALATPLAAQSPGAEAAAHAARVLGTAPGNAPAQVLFDAPGDGRIWALGSTYKASFGQDGTVYVPFFGSDAERNYPVQFVLRAVRVGGQSLALPAAAEVQRTGARVVLGRGQVREIYDLAPDALEQTFVVDTDLEGDVEIELAVASELAEDAAAAGVQFGNHLGAVDYGTAYLVTGAGKQEITTAFTGNTLRLRVPAHQRAAGPVVVDPVIRTRALTATMQNSEVPDVAYDATTDRWGIAWVHLFSQTDHDVVFEMRSGTNDPVVGSFQSIEISNSSFSWPRIANLNHADRFLVAMERFEPQAPAGQQYTIWGRTVDAAAPFTLGTLTQLSPAAVQDQLSVDVGGDPGTGTKWMVVWRHGTDIHGRLVDATGTPNPITIPIESTPSACISPQISLSNGNGLTASPSWCVVYNLDSGANHWDVYGAVLDLNGAITVPHRAIAATANNDAYPYVSSPLTDIGGPKFMVSYEVQTGPAEMIVRVVDASLSSLTPEINMTRRFGFSGIYCRVESDGSRFAATCRIADQIRVGTVAFANGDLALHEAIQNIGINPSVSPAIASMRSGGGPTAEYAIVMTNQNTTPWTVSLTRYQGRAQSGGLDWEGFGCDGLWLDVTGEPFLGRTLVFSLDNAGTEFAAVIAGFPAAAPSPCGTCEIRLDLTQPVAWSTPTLSLRIPGTPAAVGLRLAVQGFAAGSGSCQPANLRTSDTIEVTVQ